MSRQLDAAGSILVHSSSRRRRQVVRQRSAKPPSPVQIRAAPPILNSVHAVTYANRNFGLSRGFETIRDSFREQSLFECFHGVPMRCVDDVGVDAGRCGNAGMPELLLRAEEPASRQGRSTALRISGSLIAASPSQRFPRPRRSTPFRSSRLTGTSRLQRKAFMTRGLLRWMGVRRSGWL